MKGCTDESTFVGLPTRRETSSGFTNSIKFCPDTRGVGGKIIAQTTVDGFTSSRAEGGAVLLPQGFGAAINGINTTVGGGRLINSTFSYDSSIATLDGGVTVPALSFSNSLPTCNVTIDNNVFIDRAAVPAVSPPFTGSAVATSNNVVISNNKQFMNNWNNGQFPYIQFTGNNIQCVGNQFHFNSHSDTQTYRGVFFTQSPSINTQSKFDAQVAGWRLIPIVFNHTVPGQSTLSTLSLAANWPYANATGLLTFLDNETRWVSFSTGSNVVTVLTSLFNQTALTNTSGISVSMNNGSAIISGNNSFVVNDQMMFSTTVGTSGGQVVPSTVYYVVAATYNTFQVSATMGGTAITFNASSNPTSPPTAQFMPATGHTFQGMCIGYNRIAYQMRCGFSPGTNGTRATLEDLTNNIVYTFDNNMITAVQTLYMTFTPPSGTTSFTLAPHHRKWRLGDRRDFVYEHRGGGLKRQHQFGVRGGADGIHREHAGNRNDWSISTNGCAKRQHDIFSGNGRCHDRNVHGSRVVGGKHQVRLQLNGNLICIATLLLQKMRPAFVESDLLLDLLP